MDSRETRKLKNEIRKLFRDVSYLLKKYRKKMPVEKIEGLQESLDNLKDALEEEDYKRINEEQICEQIKEKVSNDIPYVQRGILREYGEPILIAFILAMFLRTFVIQAFKIPSGSMIPTLLVGDHLFVNKFIYGTHIPMTDIFLLPLKEPQRGDVVVFVPPHDRDKDYIKRVIGVEGDTIKIIDKQVFVNGDALDESYVQYLESGIMAAKRDNFGPVTVPEDSIFVMGDNRDKSNDSRFWGFAEVKEVKGKAMIIWLSADRHNRWSLKWVRWDRFGRIIR